MTLTRHRIPPATALVRAPHRAGIAAVLLGVLGVAVSALGSWSPSLWGDEAASVLSANRSIPSLFHMLAHVDAVHGAYYVGLHFWVGIFGSSPFSVRFPSALAIGVCVAGVVLLASKLDSLKLGIVAGVICAVLPRVTSMGDEARSYAFSAAIATWLTLLLVEMMMRHRRSRKQWVGYGLLLAAGIYVFLYLALIAIAHLIILLSSPHTRSMVRAWFRTILGVGIAIIPLLVVAVMQRSQISFLAQRSTANFHALTVTLWFGTALIAILCWAAITAAIGFFLIDLRKGRFAARTLRTAPQSITFVAAAWLVVPTLVLYASHFLVPDFTARYLSMCAPAAALLIAIGVVRVARFKTIPIVLIGFVLLAAIVPDWIVQRGRYGKNNSDWAVIGGEIAANAHPGDAIAFDDSTRPSRRTRLALRTYPADFVGLNDVTLRTPYFDTGSWYDTDYSITQAGALGRLDNVHTVWLIDYSTPTHTDTSGVAELRALGFTQTFTIDNHRSVVREFTR
ncbi:MAG: glycosyltransferase family 39 protein [Terrimesophilobacter sp.]